MYYFYFGVVAFLSPYAVANIEKSNEIDIFELPLEQLLEIEVNSAAKTIQTLQQAPSSITVYSKLDIKMLGATTLEELLNYIPGVQYFKEGYLSEVNFRGRRSFGNDILLILDGIRLNDPVSGSALTSFQSISLASISRVEIIKGPGSALYGSNAFNGVISLTSNQENNELSLSAGSFSHKRIRGEFHTTETDYSFHIDAESFADEGEEYKPFFSFFGESEPTNDPLKGGHLYVKGSYQSVQLQAGLHHRRSDNFVASSQSDGINHFDVESNFIKVSYPYQMTNSMQLNLSGEQVRSKQSLIITQLPASVATTFWSNGAEVDFIGGNYRGISSQRFNIDGSWLKSPKTQWHYGIEYREEKNDEITFQGNWDPKINRESQGFTFIPKEGEYTRELWWFGNYQPLVPESKRSIKTLYMQNIVDWSENIQFTAGAHYVDYSDVGNNLSMRGSIVYKGLEHTTFKFLYGEAFRAPTLYELNALIATGLIGNPTLKPETVDTLDLIWLQDWGKIQSSLTYYHSKFEDVIETVAVEDILSGFSSFQPQNLGSKALTGIELELKGNITNSLSARLSYAFAKDYISLASAQNTGALNINYLIDSFNINISGVYHSKVLSREQSDSVARPIKLDSYWLVKGHIKYALSENINLSLIGNNLLNEDYKSYSTASDLDYGVPNRGRNWLLTINWNY